MTNILNIGIDIGSTTVKVVVLDAERQIIHTDYRRHTMNVRETVQAILGGDASSAALFSGAGSAGSCRVAVTGSVGMGYADLWGFPFVQEVISAATLVKESFPQTHTFIDIGGEDSKMIFFDKDRMPDIRMNGNCAGGTGAFIDQTASLLNVDPSELNALAEKAEHVYPIASRCGVFSKTDIQNLLARNVSKADVVLSVFHAVCLQVLGTLSRGVDVKAPVFFGEKLFDAGFYKAGEAREWTFYVWGTDKKTRPEMELAPESAKQFSMKAKPVMLNVDKLDKVKEGGKVPGLKVTLSTKGLSREGWELKQKSIRKIVSFKCKKFPKATPEVLIVGYWNE